MVLQQTELYFLRNYLPLFVYVFVSFNILITYCHLCVGDGNFTDHKGILCSGNQCACLYTNVYPVYNLENAALFLYFSDLIFLLNVYSYTSTCESIHSLFSQNTYSQFCNPAPLSFKAIFHSSQQTEQCAISEMMLKL